MSSFQRLVDATARCLSRHESLVGERAVLAAVSGGLDSTLLLHVLVRLRDEGRLGGPLHVAHVDHGVHPASRAGAQAVVDLCDRFDVPVAVRTLRLAEDERSERHLRDARYRALAEIGTAVGAGALLTGHHADDNLETVLFRMLRGTGPRGLAGIPEARWLADGVRLLLVRPFLRSRRATLQAALAELGEHEVADDPTNGNLAYARNRIRHETLPALRHQLGIGLDVALLSVSNSARAASELLAAHGQRILVERTRHGNAWRLELDLRALDADSRPFVLEALRQGHERIHPLRQAPLQVWLERAAGLLDAPAGTRLAGRGGLLLERTRDGILLVDPSRAGAPPDAGDAPVELPIDGGRQRFGATEWCLEAHTHPEPPLAPSPAAAGRFRALFEPREAPLPWRMRTRRPGDRFHALGGTAPQDLRRFLQSRHLPRFDRDRLPLLVDAEDRILWVPGVEVGERVRLRLNTRRCIEVRALAT